MRCASSSQQGSLGQHDDRLDHGRRSSRCRSPTLTTRQDTCSTATGSAPHGAVCRQAGHNRCMPLAADVRSSPGPPGRLGGELAGACGDDARRRPGASPSSPRRARGVRGGRVLRPAGGHAGRRRSPTTSRSSAVGDGDGDPAGHARHDRAGTVRAVARRRSRACPARRGHRPRRAGPDGDPPLLRVDRGRLRHGPARWNQYFYAGTPAAPSGCRIEDIAISSDLGDMPAWLVPPSAAGASRTLGDPRTRPRSDPGGVPAGPPGAPPARFHLPRGQLPQRPRRAGQPPGALPPG